MTQARQDGITLKQWLPLIGLTCCAFVFNTSEFMPIGLLTDIAASFSLTEAQAGIMISVYAWGVMLLSLPLMVFASRFEFKRMLLGVLAVFSLGQFLSAVAPTGHVHTLELKEENAKRVEKNVNRTELGGFWSYAIGDAREADPGIEWQADVLTMDMPDPWLALANLDPHLRNGGRICIYVPNMNQVESSVIALRGAGYADVRALENIQRYLEVHPGGVRPSFDTLGHTGYLVFARKRALKA